MKTAEEVADKMYELIEEVKGKKKYTPRELQKLAVEIFEKDVNRKICKDAIKELTNSGRCTYSMYGGVSYVEIP
jgi:hypothetical protein